MQIRRLHITGIGKRLVYATDYDAAAEQGQVRKVCFHNNGWNISEGNLVRVDYGREKPEIEDLPTMLVDIDSVQVVEQYATPESLLDL